MRHNRGCSQARRFAHSVVTAYLIVSVVMVTGAQEILCLSPPQSAFLCTTAPLKPPLIIAFDLLGAVSLTTEVIRLFEVDVPLVRWQVRAVLLRNRCMGLYWKSDVRSRDAARDFVVSAPCGSNYVITGGAVFGS